jgi:hypothetical protein
MHQYIHVYQPSMLPTDHDMVWQTQQAHSLPHGQHALILTMLLLAMPLQVAA